MENEAVWAWISDEHILDHNCTNPLTCQLPLYTSVDDQMGDESNLRRSPRKHSGSNQSSSQSSESNTPQRQKSYAADDVFAPEELDKTPRPKASLPFHPLDSSPNVDHSNNAVDTDLAQQRETRIPILPPPTNLSMSFTATLSTSRPSLASRSRTGSSITSRTRSTSPVKNPDDLLKLAKPVKWIEAAPGAMKKRIQATNNAAALNLWNSIWNVVGGRGYIPRELKDPLQEELQAFDTKFTTEYRVVNLTAQQQEDATQIFTSFNDETKHQMSLYNELTTIRNIVAESTDFIKWNRSEAAWNDHIHGPTLRLAMSTITDVYAENITTASIDKDFLPAWKGEETDVGKMIDYTLLLRPDEQLSTDIKTFVDARRGPRTFNQSTSEHLRYKPTGVFIETKTDMKRHSEGKVQLGIWLASWFERTAQFAATKIPLMPVLLVVCARWELHFAFNDGTHYDVVGPVDVGGTGTVEDMYRLLAVLRLLGNWVGGEFREWVRHCVGT
ncbi:hypothetical protein RAB80_018256 [Fusarium oxysporum f. sp. vasinfectum]|uniref:PD-(D/E)XK nuclease-like domain-containing protein n=1 Tax=Fusarium oxysporum f. sp. vasinfectum 25433 TaxID=1089449 RepID=X0KVC5_FUSOX|nr:hypothetical protein FOTG_18876 [Fusarium oxysporum f. sp. vasinfectum 25433]KAK2666156.1 hypothetical protein RAB80_018256 [Fusarium oxysporum f. sp. vasinfectum]KAK2922432.1 hypothetical protein FoTM2_017788 [Fusarium oxysporum f. sp. vasinfectum]